MLIDREAVLSELRRRIAEHRGVAETNRDFVVIAGAHASALGLFRDFIESLPPPPSPVGAEVSALVKAGREYVDSEWEHRDTPVSLVEQMTDSLEAQEKKLAVMREALAFYADPANYELRDYPMGAGRQYPAMVNGGAWARKALEDLK